VVDRVSKTYRRGRVEIRALVDTSLTVFEGEFVAVMGPSGSGKSTLLRLIAGLSAPTQGTIDVRGRRVSAMGDDEATIFRRQHIGVIYQTFNVFPDLTLAENVSVPLLLEGCGEKEAREKVERMLDVLGLSGRGDHLPDEVSGGELQRAAIARALVAEPAILLADEPTGNLDSVTGDGVMIDIRRAVDDLKRTVILVTHDARAAAYADKIVRLRDGTFEIC
jgi:putative ABC transport system ATP-binding protein